MVLKYYFMLLLFSLAFATLSNASSDTERLLKLLDTELEHKKEYTAQKAERMATFSNQLQLLESTGAYDKAYAKCLQLLNEYQSFSYDSAFKYVQKLNQLATKTNNRERKAFSKIRMGFTLLSSGMFKEALDTLHALHIADYPDSVKIDYYHVIARTYYDLADYNNDDYFSARYRKTGTQFLDSALLLLPKESSEYWASIGLRRMKADDKEGAADAFNFLITKFSINEHAYAIATSSLGYLYTLLGRKNEAIDMLINAAIADIKSSTTETVALRNLAMQLFEKGDINRAYRYIKIALNDATAYNARHRKVEVGLVLPIIEGERLATVDRQRKQLLSYSFILSMLSVLVISFFIIIFVQLRKLNKVKMILQDTNNSLRDINQNLREANKIKQEYIGYFFNINSEYIEKIEAFQKNIHRKIVAKQYTDIDSIIKNSDLKKERENLFLNFDKIFLKIFPNFIEEFNQLLHPEERVYPEKEELLNTDLRIFALIRLGITDNERIAKFLNYSVNTIYTYKTKIKNKAVVDRERFEEKIMEIKAI
jgi:tetratricopeptide (TPR) repeat protein